MENRDLNSVNVWRMMDAAELLLEADEIDFALEILEKAAKYQYPVKNLHYLRGMIYMGRGEHEKAKEAALHEISGFPDNKNAWEVLSHYDFHFACPVCQTQVENFSPLPQEYIDTLERYGFSYKLDEFETLNFTKYICPNCGAIDRDRLYALFLNNFALTLPIGQKHKILDFAPSASFSRFISSKVSFEHIKADWLIDSYDAKIDIMDMHQFGNDTFDSVICSHVLEHVDDDKKALSELRRVLKKDGWAIIMSPVCLSLKVILEDPKITNPEERWKYFGQDDHIRLYSKKGLKDRITEAGFKIQEYTIADFGIEKFASSGIATKSVLYVCR